MDAFNHSIVPGFTPISLSNPDLRWENNTSLNFGLDLGLFNNKIEILFESIPSITERRSYLIQYLSSPLFRIYLKTGTTALNHPELQPSSIVLNTLYQIDSQLY